MNTKLLNFQPPTEAVLQAAVDVLRAGGVVAFPTETVYGLGANALDAVAVRRIFAAKGRPSNNPLIVHIADVVQVKRLAAEWPDAAAQLAKKFWPGPLTIIVKKLPTVPDVVSAGGDTVALRCPASELARVLLMAVGIPLAAPSANRTGELSPTTAQHVLKSLGGAIDMILDGGPCVGGIESTVVDVSRSPYRLLRPGLISQAQIEAVIGPLELITDANAESILPAPGLLARHYAPRTPLILATTEAEWTSLRDAYRTQGKRVAEVRLPSTPTVAAAMLYDELHRQDEAGHDVILVLMPPDEPQWAAIRDRLTRAATPA